MQVDPAHITVRMEALKELEPFQNLLKIVPGKSHEWAEVAGMFVDLEQKKLRLEEAVTALGRLTCVDPARAPLIDALAAAARFAAARQN